MHGAPVEARERDERRGDVRRLGVVDVERRRRSSRPPPGGARRRANVAQRRAHRVGVDAAREATAAAAIAFCAVVGAAQAQLVAGEQRLVGPPQLRRRGRPARRRARAEADPPRAAAEVLDAEPDRRDRDVVVALAARRSAASRRGRPRSVPWRSRWSGARFSSTAASGANASVSSSWNDETSQTTTAPGRARRRARSAAVPTLPATATGSPASRWMCAEQLDRRRLAVRAGHGDERVGQQPPGELELAEHRDPALARRGDDRRLGRHAGRLDHARAAARASAEAVVVAAACASAPVDAARLVAEDLQHRDARSGRARRRGTAHRAAAGAALT